jgi:YidC/Oxa1 family membrane protein insertase
VDGARNQLLSDGLFGVRLGAHWLSGAGLLSVHDALFLAIFAILAALCWLSSRLAKRAAPAAASAADTPKAAGLLTRVLPYVTVVIAAFAPMAAAIYLLTTVAWTLAERSLFLHRTAQTASVPVRETR